MRFDPASMEKDTDLFNEMPLDFNNCEIDPKENPLYIMHAYLNKGQYPPEYEAENERFIEDVNKRIKP